MSKLFIYFLILLASVCSKQGVHAQPVSEDWAARYNATQYDVDRFGSMTVDAEGNVYVTGGAKVGSGTFDEDCVTLKYNTNGELMWSAIYNGPANLTDKGNVIITDDAGNVYVAGVTGGDYLLIKYSADGNQLWVKIYTGPVSVDEATALIIDKAGNVIITGTSLHTGTGQDYITIKYNSAGAQQWMARYSGDQLYGTDIPEAIVLDSKDNIYITGSALLGGANGVFDCATVKYNPDGIQQWEKKYNGPGNGNDRAYDMATDSEDNIYITGFSRGTSSTFNDFITIKYNSLNGNQLWAQRYNGTGFYMDGAEAIVIDSEDFIYVTGGSDGPSTTGRDFATIKYSKDGVEQWVRRYDGGNKRDESNSIAIDSEDNIYVTGISVLGSDVNNHDYLTVKYNAGGDQQWVERYNGPDNYADVPYVVKLDGQDNVYVGGYSNDVGRNIDFLTVKYIQSSPAAPTDLTITIIDVGEIRLNWVDNSLNERSFKIERKDNIDTNWILIDSVTADVSEWEQSSLTVGRTYYYRIYAENSIGISGNSNEVSTLITGNGNINTELPVSFALHQNYPNPFNPATIINYELANAGFVSLKIYDLTGKEIATLLNEALAPGYYSIEFNGTGLPSGIYFYKLTANSITLTRKMVLTK